MSMRSALEADRFQHGLGPYRVIWGPRDEPVKICVGSFNLDTQRHRAPASGRFYVDDPELGTVFYDENLMRVVATKTEG